jgi:hypothetical protein
MIDGMIINAFIDKKYLETKTTRNWKPSIRGRMMTPFSSTRSTTLFEDAPPDGATLALRTQRTLSRISGTLLFTVVLGLLIMRLVEASLSISEHSAAAAFAIYQTSSSFLGLTKLDFVQFLGKA